VAKVNLVKEITAKLILADFRAACGHSRLCALDTTWSSGVWIACVGVGLVF